MRALVERSRTVAAPARHVPGGPPASQWEPCPPAPRQREAGAATVELVAALPLLVAVTLGMVGLLSVARDQVLAQHAAREGARAAALSGDPGEAVRAAAAALPAGRAAQVTAAPVREGRVTVRVVLRVPLPLLPPVPVRASAVAAVEPGPAPPPP